MPTASSIDAAVAAAGETSSTLLRIRRPPLRSLQRATANSVHSNSSPASSSPSPKYYRREWPPKKTDSSPRLRPTSEGTTSRSVDHRSGSSSRSRPNKCTAAPFACLSAVFGKRQPNRSINQLAQHQRRHQLFPEVSQLFQVSSCTVSSRNNPISDGALCLISECDFCPQTSTSSATPLPRVPARSTAPPVVPPVPPAVTSQQHTGNQRQRLRRSRTAAKKAAAAKKANDGVTAALNTANLAAFFLTAPMPSTPSLIHSPDHPSSTSNLAPTQTLPPGFQYPGDVSTPTADLITANFLFNGVLSHAKFMTIDIKDFYVNTDHYD
jgi:hypothetical protein